MPGIRQILSTGKFVFIYLWWEFIEEFHLVLWSPLHLGKRSLDDCSWFAWNGVLQTYRTECKWMFSTALGPLSYIKATSIHLPSLTFKAHICYIISRGLQGAILFYSHCQPKPFNVNFSQPAPLSAFFIVDIYFPAKCAFVDIFIKLDHNKSDCTYIYFPFVLTNAKQVDVFINCVTSCPEQVMKGKWCDDKAQGDRARKPLCVVVVHLEVQGQFCCLHHFDKYLWETDKEDIVFPIPLNHWELGEGNEMPRETLMSE